MIDINTNVNRRARGQILTLLHTMYPAPAETKMLANALLDAGYIATPDIKRHIDYLTEKGYILPVKIPEGAEKAIHGISDSSFFKLSPMGVDLLEESIPEDPGIDV